MSNDDVLAIINAINTGYTINQTQHMRDSSHFDKQDAINRLERPCGYFTVNATETVAKTRKEMVPDPNKKEENFPPLGGGSSSKRGAKSNTSHAMIERTVHYTEQVPITDLKRTDLDKLNQKTHLNKLLRAFFWDFGVLTWRIERQTSGMHSGQEVALVSGRIPAPYGGMTDAGGRSYHETNTMVVVLGGSGGSNYQVITAYPI